MTAVLVALGAGLGSAARYALGTHLDGRWHVGTFAANLAAALLLGACVGWSLDGSSYGLLGTGFCGGLSTYSGFALQVRDLGWARGSAYALATLLGGLGLAALGYALA